MPRPDITEMTLVRRANILQLLKDGGWDRKEFSKKTGIKYATLSSWLGDNPKGNISTKMCEIITKAMGKPDGWLDKDRRGGPIEEETTPTITLKADTLTLIDHPITKYQQNQIINLLFGD